MRPSQTFHVLEQLRNAFSAPLYRKGVALSREDNHTTLDVYQQLVLIMVDIGYLSPDTLLRDARRLWQDFCQADVYDLNNVFAECLHLVRCKQFKGFKALCSTASTHLYPLLKADVSACSSGDVFAAKRLIQLFSYTSRLSLQDIDLTQQLLEDYLENERNIPDSFPERLVSSLADIVYRWIGIQCPFPIIPSHGPGGVAGLGRASIRDKYKTLSTDTLLSDTFGDPWWSEGTVRSYLDRTSQTIFVPKSYKTFRTISMEPCTLQYFQQGIWKVIEKQVASSRYLTNHIGFSDQERNKSLAQRGSLTRRYATLDLSAASDSVSYELAMAVFDKTWIRRYIPATRSTHTLLPDGRKIELKKCSPMGSALCFPLETIIFASICELVTREYRVKGDYSVFGDDIIVPTQCVAKTIEYLEALGFHVNRGKSFSDRQCWFRESCGGEYCDGFDVSPMRVSRKYKSRERSIRLSKLISMANEAYQRDFRNLRYFFLQKLKDERYTVFFSPSELLADNYTNYHAKKRWNKNLHVLQVKATTLFTKMSHSDSDEEIRLRHWFESTQSRKFLDDGFESNIWKSTVVLKDAWRTKPYEPLDQVVIDSFLAGVNPLR